MDVLRRLTKGSLLTLQFWKFAAGIMGDESLVHFGQGFAHAYQPNEFLVLHTPIASEFSKFKIAIGTDISSTEQVSLFQKMISVF